MAKNGFPCSFSGKAVGITRLFLISNAPRKGRKTGIAVSFAIRGALLGYTIKGFFIESREAF